MPEGKYIYIYISIFRQMSFCTLVRIIPSNVKQSGIVPLKQGHLAFILPRGILDTISPGKAFFRIHIEKYQMFILHIERYRLGAHLKKCK